MEDPLESLSLSPIRFKPRAKKLSFDFTKAPANNELVMVVFDHVCDILSATDSPTLCIQTPMDIGNTEFDRFVELDRSPSLTQPPMCVNNSTFFKFPVPSRSSNGESDDTTRSKIDRTFTFDLKPKPSKCII